MNKPKDINEARRQANSFDKAQHMTQEGYTFDEFARKLFRIFKPENTAKETADYWVDLIDEGCSCPSFAKAKDTCKHILWLKAELATQEAAAQQVLDIANCEAIAAEYDAERTRLQTGLIDELLPAPFDYVPPVLTVAAVLEALQARIVQDMDRAETVMLKRDIQCFAVRNDRIRRFEQLQGALHVINDYWSKESANLLDLQPADRVTL